MSRCVMIPTLIPLSSAEPLEPGGVQIPAVTAFQSVDVYVDGRVGASYLDMMLSGRLGNGRKSSQLRLRRFRRQI
jgi:hypothetical protein